MLRKNKKWNHIKFSIKTTKGKKKKTNKKKEKERKTKNRNKEQGQHIENSNEHGRY